MHRKQGLLEEHRSSSESWASLQRLLGTYLHNRAAVDAIQAFSPELAEQAAMVCEMLKCFQCVEKMLTMDLMPVFGEEMPSC